MIDLEPLYVIIVMFSALLLMLMTGVPVVFALGGTGVIFLVLFWGTDVAASLIVGNAFELMIHYNLIAVPLFIFMAFILKSSGVIESLFVSMRFWFSGVPGGLAMGCVVVSVFIAAMSGIMYTGILTLGIIALPLMLKFGYEKKLAVGCITVAGTLGSLIPPSVAFILLGAICHISVGKLLIGGLIPGLILAGFYILYIGIRCWKNPSLGPPLPPEERVGWGKKFLSLRGLVLPMSLIILVLGVMFFGIASPTEASGIGAIGAVACSVITRKLRWEHIAESAIETMKITSMCMWMIIGAYCFRAVFVYAGGPHYVTQLAAGLEVHPLAVIAVMQLAVVFLGCFLSDLPIMLICLPVFMPIVEMLGFSRIWFGVIYLVNIQLGYITPPFGFALFLMRSVAPPEITMGDVIKATIPYMPLQIITICLLLFFPQVVLWLPNMMLGS